MNSATESSSDEGWEDAVVYDEPKSPQDNPEKMAKDKRFFELNTKKDEDERKRQVKESQQWYVNYDEEKPKNPIEQHGKNEKQKRDMKRWKEAYYNGECKPVKLRRKRRKSLLDTLKEPVINEDKALF